MENKFIIEKDLHIKYTKKEKNVIGILKFVQ